MYVAACGSDSSLPVATGKGTIRAINANPTSPEIGFLIEERTLDGMNYKGMAQPRRWDDLVYTFNFEYRPLGIGASNERVASELLDASLHLLYLGSPSAALRASSRVSYKVTYWVRLTISNIFRKCVAGPEPSRQ